MSEDDKLAAASKVMEFQDSVGWYRLMQLMERFRDEHLGVLASATKRSHLELADSAGAIRAIDDVYAMFYKIRKEGDTD